MSTQPTQTHVLKPVPWRLVAIREYLDSSPGEAVDIVLPNVPNRVVTIESWSTDSASGVDMYWDGGPRPAESDVHACLQEYYAGVHGNEAAGEMADELVEYMVADWIETVLAIYFETLDREGIDQIRALALQRAVTEVEHAGA